MNIKKYPQGTICIYSGCNNKRRGKGYGKTGPLCEKHHRQRYPRKLKRSSNSMDLFKKKTRKKDGFKKCFFCGWNKDILDLHRIIPGSQGGKYKLDNVKALCPNCHRLVHSGKLTLS
jgi:5-methylcytosine-specific restriction endonuclease McrA